MCFDIVRNFRNQDHVRAAGNARAQRQPAGAMAHDFRNDDPMMAVRRAVQTVNRLRRDSQRGVEANRRVGQRNIVVNRLGQRDDVESPLHEPQRVLVRAAAADANQRVELVPSGSSGR